MASSDAAAAKRVRDDLAYARFSWFHVQAILVAGVGFFSDAYDLFIIGLAKPAIGVVYFPENGGKLPTNVDLAITGVSLIGALTGQVLFGYLGDKKGRKSMYLLTLIIMITATIGQASSASAVRGFSFAVWLVIWRFMLGFGIGGDYPLSATIAAEFSTARNRGAFVGSVFAMQGVGILVASLVAIVTTAAFKPLILRDINYLDYVWRIELGLGVVPALLTVYLRNKLPEPPQWTLDVAGDVATAVKDADDVGATAAAAATREAKGAEAAAAAPLPLNDTAELAAAAGGVNFSRDEGLRSPADAIGLKEYLTSPSIMKNRNFFILIGTCACWFLLDIAFYSQNLFLPDVLKRTGFSNPIELPEGYMGSSSAVTCEGACSLGVYTTIYRSAVGNALVAIIGTVPGYWFTVAFVDKWGRVPIQYMGFAMMTTLLVILAAAYPQLGDPKTATAKPIVFLVLYALTFFFANFGPNATTFIIPAEVFATKFRSTLHGISAATGKLGAVVGAFGFGALQLRFGTRVTLVALAVVNFFGMLFTALVPETKQMHLDDAASKSTSTYGRRVQKDAGCPLYEADRKSVV